MGIFDKVKQQQEELKKRMEIVKKIEAKEKSVEKEKKKLITTLYVETEEDFQNILECLKNLEKKYIIESDGHLIFVIK